MDNIVAGLFGLSPNQVQQQQQAQTYQRAQNFAGQSPFERANALMYQGGAGAANVGAGMMGLVNPEVEAAKQRQAALQGADVQTPEGLRALAARLQGMGMTQQAMIAAAKANEMEAQRQENSYKKALEEKALRETEPKGEYQEVGVLNKPDWRQRVKINSDGSYIAIGEPYQIAAGIRVDASGTGGSESKQPLSYIDPETGRAVWGTIKEARGKPAAIYDPSTKELIATSTSKGKEIGGASGKAEVTLPGARLLSDEVKTQVQELLDHPGFESSVGATLRPGARFVQGSPEAGFMARYEQIQGGTFLRAYETLKGGGQITEIEGTKATVALNRMKTATDEKEFKAAAKAFTDAFDTGVKKLEAQAALTNKTKPEASSEKPNDLVSAARAELARRQGNK